jgi:hypothetical protein
VRIEFKKNAVRTEMVCFARRRAMARYSGFLDIILRNQALLERSRSLVNAMVHDTDGIKHLRLEAIDRTANVNENNTVEHYVAFSSKSGYVEKRTTKKLAPDEMRCKRGPNRVKTVTSRTALSK